MISKIKIKNFKIFKNTFELKLNENTNIIVGNNEEGKSTILEAIHLALTGYYHGKNIKNDISQYLFNSECVNEYIISLTTCQPLPPPSIEIEIYFNGNIDANFEGNNNSDNTGCEGIKFKIAFNEDFDKAYEDLLNKKSIKSLPIEYYDVLWESFSRDYNIVPRNIPINSAMIDSTNYVLQNGNEIYTNKIVKDYFTEEEKNNLSQLNREFKERTSDSDIVKGINKRITDERIFEKSVSIAFNLGNKRAWEDNIIAQLDGIPYNNLGKGSQCIIKTNLALSNKNVEKSNVILFEEPESHLSFSNLNRFTESINLKCKGKQIIIATHSSFVANKLGLNNITLLANQKASSMKDYNSAEYFKKVAGYDTLRLLLCKKAILVEGSSDELIVQKAYKDKYNKLPIQDGIDVISVGTAFLRFLEIADNLNLNVNVVTDNDGDVEALCNKYKDYINENKKSNIKICYDKNVNEDKGLLLGKKHFNYNTLEPNLLLANNNEVTMFNEIFSTNYTEINDLHKYMHLNKTDCALRIFSSEKIIKYPKYILEAIDNE